MEIILLGIYSFFVWLIFFKFKWLPWNIVSQVIVVTIPIVALTAHALTGDEQMFREAGMDAYVSKPVCAERLLEAIANCYSMR